MDVEGNFGFLRRKNYLCSANRTSDDMDKQLVNRNEEYIEWLSHIKQQIRSTQIRMIRSANADLIYFYWNLGSSISKKLKENQWGDKVIEQLSIDLRNEFSDMKGFSRQNLYYIKKFYEFYANTVSIVPQLGGQLQVADNYKIIFNIPWGHQKIIISKASTVEEALFYTHQTIDNGWSRSVLENQFKQRLYEHYGKGQNNFSKTLPVVTADMAQEVIKDPYWFDFITISQKAHERDIEKQLVTHITQFLLTLGKGFAFVGEQYCLQLNNKEYFCDLLFYHIPLRAYVVIELKNSRFKPEHLGQLNFYQNLINNTLRGDYDNPTIGMLLCRDKDRIEVEYALQNIASPIGVSEFNITEILPDDLRSNLPSIEEVERELNKII